MEEIAPQSDAVRCENYATIFTFLGVFVLWPAIHESLMKPVASQPASRTLHKMVCFADARQGLCLFRAYVKDFVFGDDEAASCSFLVRLPHRKFHNKKRSVKISEWRQSWRITNFVLKTCLLFHEKRLKCSELFCKSAIHTLVAQLRGLLETNNEDKNALTFAFCFCFRCNLQKKINSWFFFTKIIYLKKFLNATQKESCLVSSLLCRRFTITKESFCSKFQMICIRGRCNLYTYVK